MTTPDDALALIRAALPPALADLARPAIRLTYDMGGDDRPPGSTRVGGRPDLPPGLEWPRWRGTCMDFVAQIDLAAIAGSPGAADLPATGWLFVFYTAYAETWGFDPAERGSCAVLYHDGPRDALRPDYEPPDLDLDASYPAFFCDHGPLWTMPSSNSDRVAGAGPAYVDMEVKLGELQDTDGVATHLLGHDAQFQSQDLMAAAAEHGPPGEGAWRLLLQLNPPDHWGFAGILYFAIREADLAARRFAEVWALRED